MTHRRARSGDIIVTMARHAASECIIFFSCRPGYSYEAQAPDSMGAIAPWPKSCASDAPIRPNPHRNFYVNFFETVK